MTNQGLNHIKLTSSEMSDLFATYLNDTLATCMISYFLEHVEDPDVIACLEYAVEIATAHLEFITHIISNTEDYPIPVGFNEQDVNIRAPRIFSDELILHYVQNLGSMGLNTYSIALPNSSRQDMRKFYTSCVETSANLYNRSTNVLQEKGLYIRSPYIPYPKQAEFVQKQHFLAGWMGEQRPLTSPEISFLFMNLYRNTLGSALLTGLSQIAQSKEVRKYVTKGSEVATHHSAVFRKFLEDGNLPAPVPWSLTVTTSKEPVFSDKLIMFHTAALNNAGIGFYGESLGGSPRRDLSAAYARLIIEAGELGTEGANIMISNGWFEKPPSAPDRKNLAKG